MKFKKNIFFLSGKKGGFTAILPLLKLIKEKKEHNIKVILTDQHVNKKFGDTYKICKNEIGNKNSKTINLNYFKDTPLERLKGMSKLIIELGKIFKKNNCHLLIVYGDRLESLVACNVAINFKIPICHFQGGDVTGNIDEKIRHSITKLSDLHLVSNNISKNRVLKMGENKNRVFNIGDSHLDPIKKINFSKKELDKVKKKYKLKKNYIIFMMHPDGFSNKKNNEWSKNVLEVLSNLDCNVLAIYPCNDIGHQSIVQNLKYYEKKNSDFHLYKNIDHNDYVKLLKGSDFLIGNSSSGIIESTFLKIPAINLGNRQKGRLCSNNVIHSNFNKKKIIKSIKEIYKLRFRKKISKAKQLYGKGNSYLLAYKIITSNIKNLDTHKVFND